MGKAITTKEIREAIKSKEVYKKDGVFTFYRGFYYKMGKTHHDWAERVVSLLTENGFVPTIIDSGEQWKPFRGGDTVRRGSHFWVKFSVERKDEK